jgi:hypothetical protein
VLSLCSFGEKTVEKCDCAQAYLNDNAQVFAGFRFVSVAGFDLRSSFRQLVILIDFYIFSIGVASRPTWTVNRRYLSLSF